MSTQRRRPRRVTHGPQTVGTSDAPLLSSHPTPERQHTVPGGTAGDAEEAEPRPTGSPDGAPDVAASTVPSAPVVPAVSADDSDVGWGEPVASNDDQLRQDVPPHW